MALLQINQSLTSLTWPARIQVILASMMSRLMTIALVRAAPAGVAAAADRYGRVNFGMRRRA